MKTLLTFLFILSSCIEKMHSPIEQNSIVLDRLVTKGEETEAQIIEVFVDKESGQEEKGYFIELNNGESTFKLNGISEHDYHSFYKNKALTIRSKIKKSKPNPADPINLDSLEINVQANHKFRKSNTNMKTIGVVIINTNDYDNTGDDGYNSVEDITKKMNKSLKIIESVSSKKLTFDFDRNNDGKEDVYVVHLNKEVEGYCDRGLIDLNLGMFTLADAGGRAVKRTFNEKFDYDYKVYILPNGKFMGGCGASGLGTLGAARLWGRKALTLKKSVTVDLLVHELGHNQNFRHSARLTEEGSHVTYGDLICPMGGNYITEDLELSAHLYNPWKLEKQEYLSNIHYHKVEKSRGNYLDQSFIVNEYSSENLNNNKKMFIRIKSGKTDQLEISKDLFIDVRKIQSLIEDNKNMAYDLWSSTIYSIYNFYEFPFEERLYGDDRTTSHITSVNFDLESHKVWSFALKPYQFNKPWSVLAGISINDDLIYVGKHDSSLLNRNALRTRSVNLGNGQFKVYLDFYPFSERAISSQTPSPQETICKNLQSQCSSIKSAYIDAVVSGDDAWIESILNRLDTLNDKISNDCDQSFACDLIEP